MVIRSRRIRVRDVKKRVGQLRSCLLFFSTYAIIGALLLSVMDPQFHSYAGSAMIITVHLALIYGVRHFHMRVLDFSQVGVLFLLCIQIFVLLLFPILLTSDLASGNYKNHWYPLFLPSETEDVNGTLKIVNPAAIRDKIWLRDRQTGEIILPFMNSMRSEDNSLYQYWLGVIIGFLYQFAFLYNTALIILEYSMIKLLQRYLQILILESNRPSETKKLNNSPA